MKKLFSGVYAGKKVLVTGHTGFKGSWLSLWLERMGADVVGYSIDFPSDPNHIQLLKLKAKSIVADICDGAAIDRAIQAHKPEIVFHLAAQALVRESYKKPLETFHTNVMGTLNVLEACRKSDSVRAVVCITSDKVYENKEWPWGYRETDGLGGHDPYSASKACAEVALSSFRNSFFNLKDYGKSHHILMASVRAGNVIGGGDWAADRLIPDIVRACSRQEKVVIRNPGATRPWQHVLECLSGYLMVGHKLLEGDTSVARGWNFGPFEGGALSVGSVVTQIGYYWPELKFEILKSAENPHEANLLKLDCSLAHTQLGWRPVWATNKLTFIKTITWYREFYKNGKVLSEQDLDEFCTEAEDAELPWTK